MESGKSLYVKTFYRHNLKMNMLSIRTRQVLLHFLDVS